VISDAIFAIIEKGASALNIELPPEAGAAFGTYHDFLEKRGQIVNLTAISGAEDVARFHFLDSLALMSAASFNGTNVIDIGSGAGFPGVPLKIAQPSMKLTLLDSTGKRVAFLTDLCVELGIEATCLHARAEDAAREADMREQYDIALSRAVARLNTLCELCIPFIRIGGLFIAMKGVDSDNEVAEARSAIETLGAELQECRDYTIPGTDVTHRAVLIRKTAETPSKYPRRFARIQKTPL